MAQIKANIEFRVPDSQRYTIRVRVTFTVMVRVSRVSIIVSVKDSIK